MNTNTNSPFRVTVFCGASSGATEDYRHAAASLGQSMASQGVHGIYGGANVGIMGVFADSLLRHGGTVTGVIPKMLVDIEIAHPELSELIITDSMTERKQHLYRMADAFILMPGGLGSFEEFFEVLTWLKLEIHTKPCGMLNTKNYFDKLLDFLDYAVSQGFIQSKHREMIIVETEPEALLARLKG